MIAAFVWLALAADVPAPRFFSIPTLDLAGETHRQTVVDREPGQYLGHPTTLLLEDGKTILCVYPKGHGKGAIQYKRSADGGKTWSARLPTPKSWETSLETPTIHRTVDAQGRKRIVLFSGLYPIRSSISADDGATWSELQPIGEFGGIVAMASVFERSGGLVADRTGGDLGGPNMRPVPNGKGKYAALFHDDGRYFTNLPGKQTKGFRVYQTDSDDGGVTWGLPRVIAAHPELHFCEPGVLRSANGQFLHVLLRENSRQRNSFAIHSSDAGATWTDPFETGAALTGDRHVGVILPDGRHFISFRDMAHHSPTRGDWVALIGGNFQAIADGSGLGGPKPAYPSGYRVRLMTNRKGTDCAYPGVELLPDGTIVTTSYGHWTKDEPPYVVSVRLKVAELDARMSQRSAGP
jgi:hypothetical protein